MAIRRLWFRFCGARQENNYLGKILISSQQTHAYLYKNSDGKVRDAWDAIALRLTGVTISPDQKWLVAVGIEPIPYQAPDPQTRDSSLPPSGGAQPPARQSHRMIVYDMATKQPES